MMQNNEGLKIVYVLVSDEKDFFFEQLLLSVYSFRKTNKDAEIVLLIDDITNKALIGYRAKITSMVDKLIVQDLERKYNKKARSRILKTQMRKLVEGDFLYIDCDTLICEDLIDIMNYKKSAAVLDNHQIVDNKIYEFRNVIKRAKKTKYKVGYNNCHYNSGVLWCKDDLQTREFFLMWEKLWQETYSIGIDIDQLSFNEANERLSGVFCELSGIWNCQLRYGIPYLSQAKIVHYFASNISIQNNIKFAYFLTDNSLFEEIKEKEEITKSAEAAVLNARSNFENAYIIGVNSIDYQVINSIFYRAIRFFYKRLALIKK